MKLRTLDLVFASGLTATALFQNCAQPYASSTTNPLEPVAKNLPFSYEVALDQIAYMSCPVISDGSAGSKNLVNEAFFSLRAGAYRQGGLRLDNDFFLNNSRRKPETLAELLTLSPAHAHTALQLAVRKRGDLNRTFSVAGGHTTRGVDFANLLTEPGTSESASQLIKIGLDTEKSVVTGVRSRYLRDGTADGGKMEASLFFGESEAMTASYRDHLGKDAWLSLTYIEPTESGNRETNVRTPATVWPEKKAYDSGVAYGKGFALTFAPPAGARGLPATVSNPDGVPYPSNLLTAIEEKNLLGIPNDVGTWTCPSNLKFRIVRKADLAEGNCRRLADPAVLTAEQSIVRNSLRLEDWFIDWDNKCAVPKGPLSCYGSATHLQYDLTQACDANAVGGIDSPDNKLCLAFATVCYRTN